MIRNKNFVQKLWAIVNNPANAESIRWESSGQSFVFTSSFENNVLKSSLQLKSLSSFIRQLNMYGFKKKKHPERLSEFFHPYFRRDGGELIDRIRRKHLEDNSLGNNLSPVQDKVRQSVDSNPEEQVSLNETSPSMAPDQIPILNQRTSSMEKQIQAIVQRRLLVATKFSKFVQTLQREINEQFHLPQDPQGPILANVISEHILSTSLPMTYNDYEMVSSYMLSRQRDLSMGGAIAETISKHGGLRNSHI